jgi:hypothetical protein
MKQADGPCRAIEIVALAGQLYATGMRTPSLRPHALLKKCLSGLKEAAGAASSYFFWLRTVLFLFVSQKLQDHVALGLVLRLCKFFAQESQVLTMDELFHCMLSVM